MLLCQQLGNGDDPGQRFSQYTVESGRELSLYWLYLSSTAFGCAFKCNKP